MRRLLVLLSLGLALPALAQTFPPDPDVSGYITRITSPTDFQVNLFRVQLTPKTTINITTGPQTFQSLERIEPRIGQRLAIYGHLNAKQQTIEASHIDIFPHDHEPVSGIAVIDMVPQSQPPSGRLLRADGYFLLLPADVTPVFQEPLTPSDPIHANMWIGYHGIPSDDGTIVLDRADILLNQVKPAEERLRKRDDYDPSVIDDGDKQSAASKFFQGIDFRKLPAWKDAAMQQRIERIGNSLIPAYQRALPKDDPTKIDFRFQLIDTTKFRDSLSMESGIILVPYQVVKMLPSDAQLAAVLSDSIAEILEKQVSRALPTYHALAAIYYAGLAGGILVPGLGVAATGAVGGAAAHMLKMARYQSGRMSLCLMHDAGYDITAAPEAWRLLATPKGKDPAKTQFPDRSLKLYEEIAYIWRNPPAQ